MQRQIITISLAIAAYFVAVELVSLALGMDWWASLALVR